MVVSSASKAVKFQAKTPSSDRKTFAKTPHSSKTPKVPEDGEASGSPFVNKKRKLSFGNLEDNVAIPSPKTPKKTPEKAKQQKTPVPVQVQTPASLKKVKTPAKNVNTLGTLSLKSATPKGSAKKKAVPVEVEEDDGDSDEEESSDEEGDEVGAGEESDSDDDDSDNEDESDDDDDEEDDSDDDAEEAEGDAEPETEVKEEKPKVGKKKQSAIATQAELLARKELYKKMTPEEKALHNKERTVYVGNLPSKMTKEQIAKQFKRFGKIESLRIRCHVLTEKAKNRKAGVILKQFEDLPQTAFIKFMELESAQKACELNGTVLKAHHIRVDLIDPSNKTQQDKNRAVFCRNLHFDLTDDELWSAFEGCGAVKSVRIVRNPITHKGRGMGYVNFVSPSSVELALKLTDTEIKSRPVKVMRCDPPKNPVSRRERQLAHKKSKGPGGAKGVEGKKRSPKKLGKAGSPGQKARGQGSAPPAGGAFAGKQAQQQKKKKANKPSADNLKKKKIAEVLARKAK